METQDLHSSLNHGKICYLEIPALDIDNSMEFYREIFGWKIRTRSDGHLAFDDSFGAVSGTWVLGRKPLTDPGLIIYLMVDDIHKTIQKIIELKGKLVQDVGVDAPEITARFSDPAGNVLGLYQEPGIKSYIINISQIKAGEFFIYQQLR